jgi:nuclear cap-binding protein subunit 1
LQGVNLEFDSYAGPGPTRELEEALKGTSLEQSSPQDSAVEEEDVDMDASPYNDRRRDNRDNRRGGGGRNSYGGGGGGGNRKRGREEDEEPRDYVKRQTRPRYEEPIASKIRRDIIFIGEESLSSSPADHCAAFGRDIASNFEDDQVSGNLLDTLVAMICEQPLKIPFIAAVALYANDLNPAVSKELIARTSKKMTYALELGDWRDFKVLLRFHACLQDILEGPGVFTILNQLFDWVIDLQSSSAEDVSSLRLDRYLIC